MRPVASRHLLLALLLSLFNLATSSFAQSAPGVCGSQAFCVETNDFVAVVTSFKTSTSPTNVKIIDATVRFQNKTAQQLILGYAVNSGVATDDRGNRLVVAGPNGYRGIGLVVAGTNFDPRFAIKSGGYADARFELLAQGWPKLVGFNHSLELTVNEINSYEGNQHTIGGEFPLHFQGLTNGSASSAGLGALTSVAANSPCGLAGAQGVAGQAGGAVATAANTISNLGSLFHRKKTEQNANQVANSAAGCDPRVNNVASTAGGLVGMAAASNAQQASANAAQAQAQQQAASTGGNSAMQQMAAAGNAQAALNTAALEAQTNPQAAAVVASNPANLATSAFSKMKAAQLKKQQKNATAQTQASPQQVAALNSATAALPTESQPSATATQMNMVGAQLQGAQLQEQANPNQMTGASTKAVSAGKYDILGIRIGMPAKEAAAILRGRGMQLTPETIKYDFLSEPLTYGVLGLNQQMLRTSGSQPGGEKVYVLLTMPPNQQTVAKVSRFMMFTKDNAPSLDGLMADLIKKYGTPSYDSHQTDLYQSGYREFYWVDDAQGHRMNVTAPSGYYNEQVNNCRSIPTFAPQSTTYPNDPAIEVDSTREKIRLEKGFDEEKRVQAQCANLTIVYAKLIYGYPIGVAAHDVVGGLVVVVGSAPNDRVTTEATHNFLVEAAKNRDARQKQAAQKNKPAL
jgi:hypothetical protein